jgi:hypothetical protein
MKITEYVPITLLCENFNLETSFFLELNEFELIEVTSIEQEWYVHKDLIHKTEKIIRIHKDLNVNIEGIDIVFNLLQKVDELQDELNRLQNRLNP